MTSPDEKRERRSIGGYKATLHNPNASVKAKLHAGEVLEDHGISSAPDIQINTKTEAHKHADDKAVHKHEHTHSGGEHGGVKKEVFVRDAYDLRERK